MIGSGRAPVVLLLASVAAAAIAVLRHRGAAMGHTVPGGILVGDPAAYDSVFHRFVFGSLYEGIADDVAEIVPVGARVLDVGCGPGALSLRLAYQHGLDVTGVDLDPAMIELAREKAQRSTKAKGHSPSFVVGDVASLPFPDDSFDLVVSTLSMHHWADPTVGLAEIGRVLRPDGRAIVWDVRRGLPFHGHQPDPAEHWHTASLRVVSAKPWRWPWNFAFLQRIEFTREAAERTRQ